MLYFIGVITASMVMVLVWHLFRKRAFKEKYAVWWLIGAITGLFVSIFPVTLDWISSILGIQLASNLAFFLTLVLLIVVSVQYSAELSRLENRILLLAEHIALLEEKTLSSSDDD